MYKILKEDLRGSTCPGLVGGPSPTAASVTENRAYIYFYFLLSEQPKAHPKSLSTNDTSMVNNEIFVRVVLMIMVFRVLRYGP